jgi:hypothetical protein
MADRQRISPVLGVLGVVVIGLFTAGCGGGNDAASISKAEFVKRADAVCAETGEQIASGVGSFVAGYDGKEPEGEARAAAEAELVETVMVPNKENEVEQLREIGAPQGDEDQVEAIADALEEGIDEAKKRPEEAVQGKSRSILEAEQLARDYGLKGC